MNTKEITEKHLTPAQQALSDFWDEHVREEMGRAREIRTHHERLERVRS
jgi:hypothetical protein